MIVLHSTDAQANRARRYVIVLTVDATADMPYRVVTQWGREGRFRRGDSLAAGDVNAALDHMRAILNRRKAHGYTVTHVDDGHPLARWLRDAGIPTVRDNDDRPRLFPLPAAPAANPMQGRLFR